MSLRDFFIAKKKELYSPGASTANINTNSSNSSSSVTPKQTTTPASENKTNCLPPPPPFATTFTPPAATTTTVTPSVAATSSTSSSVPGNEQQKKQKLESNVFGANNLADKEEEEKRRRQIADETLAGMDLDSIFPSSSSSSSVSSSNIKSSNTGGGAPATRDAKTQQHGQRKKRVFDMITPSPQTATELAAAVAAGGAAGVGAAAAAVAALPGGSGTTADGTGTDDAKNAKRRRDEERTRERYQFLKDRRDVAGRRPGDPDFDPKTLFIPQDMYLSFTQFERQYWDVKRHLMDTVLFYKKGYFYELFQEDADIGARVLGLKISVRGNMRMAGAPIKNYHEMARRLLDEGYQVSRVDEVETKLAMEKRVGSAATHSYAQLASSGGTADTIMRRELAEVLTRGTVCDDSLLPSADDNFVVSLLESPGGLAAPAPAGDAGAAAARSLNLGATGAAISFGVCLCSCSVGQVFLTRLDDDASRTLLETLLVQTRPTQVIFERGNLTSGTVRLLKRVLGAQTLMTTQAPAEWWSAEVTLDECRRSAYFIGAGLERATSSASTGPSTAASLQQRTAQRTSAAERNLSQVSRNDPLMLGALGGCVQELRRNKIDQRVLRGASLARYDPARAGRCMVIDGRSLANLEVLANSLDGSRAGTLLELLDQCATAFGSRMMRRWICHPLRLPADIDQRLDAAEDAAGRLAWRDSCRQALGRLPDLERLVARVCTGAGRLIDVCNLLTGLQRAHDVVVQARAAGLTDVSVKSTRLRRLVTERKVQQEGDSEQDDDIQTDAAAAAAAAGGGGGGGGGAGAGPSSAANDEFGLYPDLSEVLRGFEQSFDMSMARSQKELLMSEGVDEDLDQATDRVATVERKLNEQLAVVRRAQYNGDKKVKFSHMANALYAVEVPLALDKRKPAPRDFTRLSQTKSVVRYRTPAIEALLPELTEARDQLQAAQKNALHTLQARLGRYRREFRAAVDALAELDCLLALNVAADAMQLTGPVCRPQFAVDHEQPDVDGGGGGGPPDNANSLSALDLVEFRHPCLAAQAAGAGSSIGRVTTSSAVGLLDSSQPTGSFVSNDLRLGCTHSSTASHHAHSTAGEDDDDGTVDAATNAGGGQQSIALITGPNMGGKSTMLRQTCVVAIMAQVGCYVPARHCSLSPVDRIFTRLGAQDAIMHGQSTFMVELNEAALILEAATPRSLVIIDELGRGTSTADGAAIAGAVLADLATRIRCRCLFATHYHALSDEFRMDPRVQLCHMACSLAGQRVLFQYKLAPGDCPRSHGNYVARMAGVPESVIQRAEQVAQHREFAHAYGELLTLLKN